MYRIRAERAARGITGFSMGGYGALRIGFAHPELFGSVSAHSAALMRDPPQGVNAGASAGNLAARILTNVFGNPIDQKFWDLNSPFLLAKKNSAMLAKTKIYFDCGTEDSYGFNRGASEMDQGAQFPENPARIPSLPGRAQRFLSPRPPGSLVRIPLARCSTRRTNLKTFHIDARVRARRSTTHVMGEAKTYFLVSHISAIAAFGLK